MDTRNQRPYRALVRACGERDISRTTSYDLIRRDLIETFLIGRRRYVYLDSLDSLPERIAAASAAKAVA